MGETVSLNWRVLAATIFSAVLVIGAYIFAKGVESPSVAQASTETELLQALATRDSNGDGLPDWQKSLYGIPLNSTTTDYFNLGMTDGEAVARGLIVPKAIADIRIATSSDQSARIDPSLPPAPGEGTLTDAFAKSFFTLYLDAKQANGGVELSAAQIDDLANQTLLSLSSMIAAAPNYKSAEDLTIAGSGEEALKVFAASVEAIVLKNKKESGTTKNEIFYLQDVVQNNDPTALPQIVAVAKMYRDTAAGLATLPIPQELAVDGLALINAMMRASAIASDFARVNADPLATMLALDQYAQVDESMVTTFSNIARVYTTAGVTLPAGAPGATFLDAVKLHE